jgi:hypothetical protein
VDEVLRYFLTGTGGLGILVAVTYAVLRTISQDRGWKELLDAKDAEIDRLNGDLEQERRRRHSKSPEGA